MSTEEIISELERMVNNERPYVIMRDIKKLIDKIKKGINNESNSDH